MILNVFSGYVTEATICVRFGDANTETYKTEEMDKLLPRWEKMKKEKKGQHCHDQWKHFSPFFLSADWMMGKEAQSILTTLSQLTATKME